MCTALQLAGIELAVYLCGMPFKTLSEKIAHLEQQLAELETAKNSYRSQAVTAECEVIRLNKEIKKQREDLAAVKVQNSVLIDRIYGLLHEQELKQS